MNARTLAGLALGGGTMAFDRLVCEVPDKQAIALYAAAVILLILGMASKKKSG